MSSVSAVMLTSVPMPPAVTGSVIVTELARMVMLPFTASAPATVIGLALAKPITRFPVPVRWGPTIE